LVDSVLAVHAQLERSTPRAHTCVDRDGHLAEVIEKGPNPGDALAALRTNFVLVDLEDAKVDVGKIVPYSEDRHRELEGTHGTDYIFRRRDDALEVARTTSNAAPLDLPFEQRRARKLGKLLNSLIERGIERYILNAKVALVRRKPLKIVSLEQRNDIAHALFGQGTQRQLPLHVRRGFRIEARTVYLKAGPRSALVIDAVTHAELDGTCADLIADDFDLRGLYVLSLDPADARWGRPTTVGQVQRVEGSIVHLGADRRGECSQYEAAALTLDLGPAALPRVLRHYVGPEAHEKLWGAKNTLATGSQRWERISRFVERLAQSQFEIAPGAKARLTDWVTDADLGQSKAQLPRFVVGSGKTSDSTTGLFRSGPRQVPLSAKVNGIRVCVICERARREEVASFLTAFSKGVGSHRPLSQTWKIGDMTFTPFEADGSSASDYEKACRAAIDEGTAWQLVLVQVPSDTQDAPGDENPYLVTKAKLLARNIPVQEFRVETMKMPINQLQWALGGIGLQVFAKLGGIPWLLQTNTKAHELILGLGSASLGTGRFGDRERVVGLTTAFSGDGTYWLTETSRTVKYDEHEEAVIESAVAAFKRVRERMAWRSGDEVRVVLHSFKDFRDKHVDALKQAVLNVAGNGLKVQFAFLHIAEDHPILLFDLGEKQRIPPRGSVVRMGRSEALVVVLGPSEVRNNRLGFPRPVCVKLHRSSTYTDLDYLSWQALAFSALSWRNFTPTSVPITVLYAELIAGLLARLGSLSKWDPDVLRGDVGASRWFL